MLLNFNDVGETNDYIAEVSMKSKSKSCVRLSFPGGKRAETNSAALMHT